MVLPLLPQLQQSLAAQQQRPQRQAPQLLPPQQQQQLQHQLLPVRVLLLSLLLRHCQSWLLALWQQVQLLLQLTSPAATAVTPAAVTAAALMRQQLQSLLHLLL